ncbi:cyclic nucleotide-binding domain-containing protein [Actinoplanes solisilvae]|uniref:cyclic nucleotide-binding domain-containing protein n=1 Tax=Actinoplanes solisilvae TaxID=2486853 RepID=UPI00196AB65F|nr:cyclic nucleotide-binding domain-containing protein [Actinoplanes solisilvae]
MSADLTDRVSALPFFAGLAPRLLRQLCAEGRLVRYPAGKRLFGEGGDADRFWLIEDGSVALDLRVPGRGDQVIETLGAGTVVGWSWLHPPYRWSFGAATRSPVQAVVFAAAAVRGRCDTDPAFGYAMLRLFTPVITERLQATRLRLLDLYATPAPAGRS